MAHTDATVRSLHSRCKDQVLGTTETVVKYQGTYPAGWGEVRPTLAWQERLFRAEELDHDSPRGVGACARVIVNLDCDVGDAPGCGVDTPWRAQAEST